MNIFFDMDGLLANFEKGFQGVYGIDSNDLKARLKKLSNDPDNVFYSEFDKTFWAMVAMIPNFWVKLDPFPEQLHDIKKYMRDNPQHTYKIISTVPGHKLEFERACREKREWVNRYIGDHMICYFMPAAYYGQDVKSQFCESNKDVLIDDSSFNVDGWRAKGGLAIKYVSACEIEMISEKLESLRSL